MTIEDFAKLVKDMRSTQREYFRDRTPDALRRSKDLEKQVDDLTNKIINKQTEMFSEDKPA